jgi:hypothetical protein
MNGLLFGLDLAALILVALAWAVSETVGYSGRVVTAGGRAWVFDTVMGEVAVWTGQVTPHARVDNNRDGVANDDDGPGDDPPNFFYDRSVAWSTQRWFDGPPRPRQAPGGGDRGVFVLGFGYGQTGVMYFAPPLKAGTASRVFVVPHWAMIALLLVWPVRRAVRQWRADRANKWRLAGRCTNCGYDLRASPARCPECGAEAPVVGEARDATEGATVAGSAGPLV